MSFLDPVLGWSLMLPPFWGILAISVIITLIINIVYKYATDQKEMKRLKNQIDDFRLKMKESRSDPKKMLKLNNEAMGVNLEYMKRSLKPTLFTFIPIIFIFAWMNAHYTYSPLGAGDPLIIRAQMVDGFTGEAHLVADTLITKDVNSTVQSTDKGSAALFPVSGSVGAHNVTITYKEFSYNATVWFGVDPVQQTFPGKGPVKSIDVEYPHVKPFGESFSLYGWYPGWLFVYIVLSIALSIGTRKLMKIY